MLAQALQCGVTLCQVGRKRERGHGPHEKRIAFNGVVAQSTSVHSNERTLARTLSMQFIRGKTDPLRVVTHLEDLKICYEDDLYGQWRNGNIHQLQVKTQVSEERSNLRATGGLEDGRGLDGRGERGV
jgi:hypothetical protein